MGYTDDDIAAAPPAPWWAPPPDRPDRSASSGSARPSWWLLAMVALVAAVIGGLIGGALAPSAATPPTGPTSPATVVGASPAPVVARSPGSVAAIAAAVLPSVVSIQVQTATEQATGSGVILTSNGYILTNNHVVQAAAGGSGTMTVTLQTDQVRNLPATIVGQDNKSDLAVVKINVRGATPARLGDSNLLAVGDPVIAIGTPLGLAGTVTTGIVSALNRPVLPDPSASTDVTSVLDAIQTDAPINPGNSGGALVNAFGQVIGINSAIATLGAGGGLFAQSQQSGSIGLGFAIPIDYARSIANQLIEHGHAVHPVIGVSVQSGGTCPDSSNALPTSLNGALVCAVVPGSPAARAGLRAGDIIIGFDNEPIVDSDTLVAFTRVQTIGSTHTITYLRGGERHMTRVQLGSDGGH